MKFRAAIVLFIAALAPASVRADIIVVKVPNELAGTGVVAATGEDDEEIIISFEGTASDTKQAVVTVVHEKFRKNQLHLYFGDARGASQGVYIKEIIPVPSRKKQF